MHGYRSLVDLVTGALGGRRVYAWIWFHAVAWCMFLFALTGPIDHGRYEAKTKLLLGAIALSTLIFVFLVVRARLTGRLYEYFFSQAQVQRPAKDVCVFIRYVTPTLCLGSCLSRWFFKWYFE
jgi:hypothetical protein